MKAWAKKFYKSKAWQQCRGSFIISVHGLCNRCTSPGKIVHHQILLTPNNINDPYITLNHEHLEYLCQTCHNKEHFADGEAIGDGLMFDEHGNLIERVTW